MTKQEFLAHLKGELCGLPNDEIEQRIVFYEEIIDDKIEEGLNEEDAVHSLGSVRDIVDGIIAEIPIAVLIKKKIKPKRPFTGWEIGLIITGSPIWGALLISLFAVAFSLYASMWAVLVSLWVSAVAIALSSVAGVVMLFIGICVGNIPIGFVFLGIGLFLGGLSVFAYDLLMLCTKAMVRLTVKIPTWVKRLFIKKEEKK
ncbi:MAG: DUF1700 domain-containing protein [Clostridia bacterium]|nr:DUF1700 domain-containing protein [Clostridia bacterium]